MYFIHTPNFRAVHENKERALEKFCCIVCELVVIIRMSIEEAVASWEYRT